MNAKRLLRPRFRFRHPGGEKGRGQSKEPDRVTENLDDKPRKKMLAAALKPVRENHVRQLADRKRRDHAG